MTHGGELDEESSLSGLRGGRLTRITASSGSFLSLEWSHQPSLVVAMADSEFSVVGAVVSGATVAVSVYLRYHF